MLKLPKYAADLDASHQLRGAFLQLYRRGHDRAADRPAALLRHRRPFDRVIGSAILYYLIRTPGPVAGRDHGLVCVLSILVTSPWGVIVTYINERFVTDVRATGFEIGFSLSVIIPSFYAFYMNWLGAVMPFELTPVFLLAVGAIIGTIGAAMGPETKDVDFH